MSRRVWKCSDFSLNPPPTPLLNPLAVLKCTISGVPGGTVRYCTVLCCFVLYCTVLHCTVLYCTVLYVLRACACMRHSFVLLMSSPRVSASYQLFLVFAGLMLFFLSLCCFVLFLFYALVGASFADLYVPLSFSCLVDHVRT